MKNEWWGGVLVWANLFGYCGSGLGFALESDFIGFFFIFLRQDIAKLTPLSPEVISRQATINIGTIGHVAHGKSTVVKAISGVHTVRFKNELERNITIKLGKSIRIEILLDLFIYRIMVYSLLCIVLWLNSIIYTFNK